jgi:hypothetical protein
MAQYYKISKARLAEIIKEEYQSFEHNRSRLNEARFEEYGRIDAEDGNPPTKIGRGNEEYMAAYNAVLVARGEEPLEIEKPDERYLDALGRGQLSNDYTARNRKDETLDPVGEESEDGDIDNDGDKDESDEYLAKRRKAIGQAIKKESLDSIRDLIAKELKNL